MANIVLPGTGQTMATDDIVSVHHQKVKISVGEDGTANNVSTASPLPTADTISEIALGNRPGWSSVNKYGENPDIDTGSVPEDIWDAGGEYIFSSTAAIDSVSSSSGSDTGDITIIGLDTNWDEVTQTITMTGQTRKALTTSLIRVNRAFNAGSADFVGDVYIYENTTLSAGVPIDGTLVRAKIRIGHNQTLMCVFSVPNAFTSLMCATYLSSAGIGFPAAAAATCSIRIRSFGSVFRTQHKATIMSTGSSTWSHSFLAPLVLEAKSDVVLTCEDVTDDNTAIAGAFDLVLVAD